MTNHVHFVTRIGEPANLLAAIEQSLSEVLRTPDGVAAPAMILWTDPERQWMVIVPRLRQTLPTLCALGEYDEGNRTGPAIWLRCIADGAIELPGADKLPPVFYLPGVARQELRATADCSKEIEPLVELQFRGAVWHQRNGRDWSVPAFMMSEDGLGLDLAHDDRTMEALLRSLPLLADVPLRSIQGQRLEADDFDRLAVSDPIRDMINWMGAGESASVASDSSRWQAFQSICKKEFSFDPEKKTPADACSLLVNGKGKWNQVWNRFVEMPRAFAPLESMLEQVKTDLVPRHPERLPKVNEEQESALRKELGSVPGLTHDAACKKVLSLEKTHGKRREWVWAELDRCPLAVALEPLSVLAQEAQSPCGGSDLETIVADYAERGWRCDQAALRALSSEAGPADCDAIRNVVRCLYEPWLDTSARRFQQLAESKLNDIARDGLSKESLDDTCVAFADGLRLDIAVSLKALLEKKGMQVSLSHRVAPLPTVTATAKPLATPIQEHVEGRDAAENFEPALKSSGKPANATHLRKEMGARDIEVLDPGNLSSRSANVKTAWCEMGRLDELGHKLGCDLVGHIEDELERLANGVEGLLDNGWSKVRVVTDHGWLLLPGGLPKTELPPSLVATKWSRCAVVSGDSTTNVPTFPWFWNEDVRIATPPGIGAFVKGTDYAHGGLSLQECVVPELVIERTGGTATAASIDSLKWKGMRCRIQVETEATSLSVDLRLNWRQPETSITVATKELDESGSTSLIVDDEHEGAAATVVVVDSAGMVLDRKTTTVGEER